MIDFAGVEAFSGRLRRLARLRPVAAELNIQLVLNRRRMNNASSHVQRDEVTREADDERHRPQPEHAQHARTTYAAKNTALRIDARQQHAASAASGRAV